MVISSVDKTNQTKLQRKMLNYILQKNIVNKKHNV